MRTAERIPIALVGAGNIARTRHFNALRDKSSPFQVRGVIDTHGDRAEKLASQLGAKNAAVYEKYSGFENLSWLRDVKAVIIATPPHEHEQMVSQALDANLHVLVEKPFVIDVSHGRDLVARAQRTNRVLAVNHNFQYSLAFRRLDEDLEKGALGTLTSYHSFQFSNGSRRLPAWSDSLPGGLFYDESPHVLYLLRRFGKGEPRVTGAQGRWTGSRTETPAQLSFNLEVGGLPANVYINFQSPICEWFFCVFGEERVGIVDLFRDIYISLPNDGQHLMAEVLRTSGLATVAHWRGFVGNGFRYVRGRLHYGFDETHQRFASAILGERDRINNMRGEDGLAVNALQHELLETSRP